MDWATAEKASLGASAAMAAACAVVGFRWVKSPYFKGYASAAAGAYAFSRLAAALR